MKVHDIITETTLGDVEATAARMLKNYSGLKYTSYDRAVDHAQSYESNTAQYRYWMDVAATIDKLDRANKKSKTMKISEIQRVKGDNEPWYGSSDTVTKDITPMPDNPEYGFKEVGYSERDRINLTGTDKRFDFFARTEEGYRYIGYIGLRRYTLPGFKNTWQVSNTVLDSNYRGRGVGVLMYKTILQQGFSIVADITQTPQAIGLWARLSETPGVLVRGKIELMRGVFDSKFANNWNEDEIKSNQRKIKKLGAQPLVNYSRAQFNDHVPFVFPVKTKEIKLKDRIAKELYASGVKIYHKQDIDDVDDFVTLVASWIG